VASKEKIHRGRNILQQRLAATQPRSIMQRQNNDGDEKGGTQDVDELQQQIEQQREELQTLQSGDYNRAPATRDGDSAAGGMKRRAVAASQSSSFANDAKADNIDDDIENQSPSKSKPRRVYHRTTIENSVSMLQSMYHRPAIVKELCKVSVISRRYLLVLKYFGIISFVFCALQFVMLNLPTRYDLQSATNELLNDQQLLNSFEEEAGLKFIQESQYTSMNNELNSLSNRVNQLNTELEDVSMIQSMIDTLELDTFCPNCLFSVRQSLSCIGRVNMLRAKHRTPKYKAMMSVMQTKSCRRSQDSSKGSKLTLVDTMNRSDDKIDVIKQPPQTQGDKINLELRERAERTEIDIIVKGWDKYQADFCHNCYIESMASSTTNKPKSCIEEASSMLNVDNQGIASIAKVMVRFPRCRLIWYNEQMRKMHKNKNVFCGNCILKGERDTGVRCAQHMQSLISTRKIETPVALYETMENEEVCTKRVGP
jgi:hypothetical protein